MTVRLYHCVPNPTHLHCLFFVKARGPTVDIGAVARSLALISFLAALAVGGYLYMQSAEETVGPSGAVVQDAATEAAADATLLVARTGVESFFATTGTYVGATSPHRRHAR